MDIAFDRYSMVMNGRREFIRSGAMHYFRLPSQELWEDRLFKLRAAGYNAVDLYFCWDYHSPAEGAYDFTGIRDVRRLLEITRELGLYVIARPGPYINAEYSGGGFPGWLLAKKDIPLRNRREGAFEWSDEYMKYVRQWWEQIIPIINGAPNVLMVQIENEYCTLEVEPDYMRALYDMARELGVTVPLFHNDLYVAGLYEDIVDIYAFDNYSVTQFETNWRDMPEIFQVLDNVENNLRPFCRNRPLMAAELQAGWYGTWKGYSYNLITEQLGREHIGISTKSLIGQGLTVFNHYKAIGGTNWSHTGSIETYTSYDFGAPIAECGLNTERLFEAKALNYFLKSFTPQLIATERRNDPAVELPFEIENPADLYAVRSPIEQSGTEAPDACWAFLRNLTWDVHENCLDHPEIGNVPLRIYPFEVLILPYEMPLACGATLKASSVELLYQNERLLVVKGNRPGYMVFSGELRGADVPGDATVEENGVYTRLHFPEMSPDSFCRIALNNVTVLVLGQQLFDTFWLQEDGRMVMGPPERLPGGFYRLAPGQKSFYRISDAGEVTEEPAPKPVLIKPPLLLEWEVFDDATELLGEGNFVPVSGISADFDQNRLYEGSAWYKLRLDGPKPGTVEVDARHIWGVFLNGHLLGHGHHLVLTYGLEAPPPVALDVPDACWRTDGPNELLVFVDGLGHPKGFHDDAQTPQGLLTLRVDGKDPLGEVAITADFIDRAPGDDTGLLPVSRAGNSVAESPIVRLRQKLRLPFDERAHVQWGLQLCHLDYERVNIYLNGVMIGRYWEECRGQDTFYLPTGILKTGAGAENCLELLCMRFDPYIPLEKSRPSPEQVSLAPYGVFTKVFVHSKLASS